MCMIFNWASLSISMVRCGSCWLEEILVSLMSSESSKEVIVALWNGRIIARHFSQVHSFGVKAEIDLMLKIFTHLACTKSKHVVQIQRL